MKLCKVVEILTYFTVFILMFKLSESASVNRTNEEDNQIMNAEESSIKMRNFNLMGSLEGRTMNFGNCEEGLSITCLKMEFIRLIENIAEKDEVKLFSGLEIIKDTSVSTSKPSEVFAEIARSYPNDPSSRLNGYIVSKLTHYFQSHFLRLKLVDDNSLTEARSIAETGRGKAGKKGGGMEALMAAGIVMKGTLLALGLGALAMLAGKALTTALMALMLSALVGLKGLGGGGDKKYEIIAKPIYTSSHHDAHGHDHAYTGYGRSFQLEKPSE